MGIQWLIVPGHRLEIVVPRAGVTRGLMVDCGTIVACGQRVTRDVIGFDPAVVRVRGRAQETGDSDLQGKKAHEEEGDRPNRMRSRFPHQPL